jgi:adenylyl cyclase-associated protein
MNNIILPTIRRLELTAIIRRLEAATSRLEDIASATIEPPQADRGAPAIASAHPPTSAPTGPLPPAPGAAVGASAVKTRGPSLAPLLPQAVEEFDLFITGPLKKFVNLSDEVGGAVAEQVGHDGRAQ